MVAIARHTYVDSRKSSHPNKGRMYVGLTNSKIYGSVGGIFTTAGRASAVKDFARGFSLFFFGGARTLSARTRQSHQCSLLHFVLVDTVAITFEAPFGLANVARLISI